MNEVVQNLRTFATEELPGLIIPIAILVVGWIIALLLAAITRRGLRRTKLDDRIAERILGKERADEVSTERWAGRIVYYVVLLFTVLAFLQSIELTAATTPISELLSSLLAFVPNLIGAAAIALVAWMIATLARALLTKALDQWSIDRKLARETRREGGEAEAEAAAEAAEPPKVGRAIAEAGYWLVWLMFVPALLDALELEGLLVPVRDMMGEVLAFMPNIASALLIIGIGWLVARIVQRLVTSAFASAGLDRLSTRVGIDRALGEQPLSALLGLVVYILILVPVAIGGLQALQLESVTQPASSMLESFFAAVPAIFGAALVVAIGYVAGRLLYGLVRKLLHGVGFDNVLQKIGLRQEQLGKRTPSELIGGLVMIAVVYFAAVEAARLLGFEAFAAVATSLSVAAGHVVIGLVVFGFGLYFARLAADAIRSSEVTQARVLAIVTRASILTLAGAMALKQMGIADEIIELAFGLLLGSIAIAAAIAFGLGGRDAASKTIEDARRRLSEEESRISHAGGAAASPHSKAPADKERE